MDVRRAVSALRRAGVDVRRAVAAFGRACVAGGVLVLLFVAYQLWGTGLAEARSQDRLQEEFFSATSAPAPTAPPAGSAGRAEPGPASLTTVTAAPPVPTGNAVAILEIPKLGVVKAVIEGVSVGALKEAPGHYPGTPMPGQPGNAAIAGHRTTYGAPFFRLDELSRGDDILVTTRQGAYRYRVERTSIVRPDANEVLDPSEENLLTLTTCNPRFSASQRLIVVASLVDTPAVAPAPAPAPAPDPPAEPGSSVPATDPGPDPEVTAPPLSLDTDATVSGRSAPKLPAIAWGVAAALVWLLAWAASRKIGRLAAYAVGTPIFLVVLFIFFENFARLLPANV